MMKILDVNGTKVVHHYLPSKLTNIQILTNVGSANEDENHEGYAHILEHNFFKGSVKRPGPMDIQTAANDIGGKINAFTSIDVTNYYISTLNEFFREGFDILADMYQNPLFPEDEFVKELNPILSEMRRYEDDPDSYLSNRMMPVMLGRSAGHPIIGTEESVKGSSVEKIRAFCDRYYGGNNTMISVVGGVKEDEVIAVISDLFPADGRIIEKPAVPEVKHSSGKTSFSKPGITEAVYSLNYPALDRFHPDRYKQSLMSYILGGNDSGMLHEQIRENLGLSCYGIYASQGHFDSHSILEISTGIAPEQLDQCHDEVMGQIKKITTDRIDSTRLARAKASLRTSIAAASENSGGYNSSISIAILKGMTENPLEKLLAEIEATTIDDVIDMAQRTFSVEPFKGVLLPE
jgi:predicted Zn-dependent peptidase